MALKKYGRGIFHPRPRVFNPGHTLTLPAPYGGLNMRDDITSLLPNQAIALENWMPEAGQLRLRDGSAEYATSIGSGEVKTLAAFESVTSGSEKLITAGGGAIYDCSSSGSGTQLDNGFSNDRWQYENYGNKLSLVNGEDAPQTYDGSTLSATSWSGTGLTISNLVNVANIGNRLWFCENNSADVWYGGTGAITGSLTKFQLSQIARGGYCMAIGSWSRDAGDGADDYTVFVMSTGELIIYAGDPATTFSLVGRFVTNARPIGRRCIIDVGGELIIITRQGLMPVSAATAQPPGQPIDLGALDPWGRVAPGIRADAKLHGNKEGWHGTTHDGVIYINVPQTVGALSKQYVLNTSNQAWTTFTGINAGALQAYGDELYFGDVTGGVVKKIEGSTDDGADIVGASNGAFIFPQAAHTSHQYTNIRPNVSGQGAVSGIIGVDTNFFVRPLVGESVDLIQDPSTTPWGSDWGSPWGTGTKFTETWFKIVGKGRAVSVRMRASAQASDLTWLSTDILYKRGGVK